VTKSFTATISSCTRALACAALALGCARGPAFADYEPIPAELGRVYVYRPTGSSDWLADADFEIDGEPVVDLAAGGYATVLVKPGRHEVRAYFDQVGPDFNPPVSDRVRVEAGRAMFCRFSSGHDVITIHWQIECTDDADAHVELRACKRQDLDDESPFER
jgi:hypothetical protein